MVNGWLFYSVVTLFAVYWIFMIYLEILTNRAHKRLCKKRPEGIQKASFYLFGYAKKMKCLKEFKDDEEVKQAKKLDEMIKKLSAIMLLLLAFWILLNKFK